MAFAQGSRSSLSFITESTFGTTPTGNFTNLPFSTHSLNLTKDRLAGTDIQADRMARVDRHGNRQVGGDIVVDLRDGDYDVLLESAMLNTWATNVLKVGVAPKRITRLILTKLGYLQDCLFPLWVSHLHPIRW